MESKTKNDDQYAEFLDERGQVRADKVEDLLIEVVSGKLIFQASAPPHALYAARCPSAPEQDRGRIVYTRRLHEARAAGIMTRAEIERLALDDGQIDADERKEKDEIVRMLRRHFETREKTPNAQQRVELMAEIEKMQERLFEIEATEHTLFRHSAEAKAEEHRQGFFIACCTTGGALLDQPVWPTFEHYLRSDDWPLIHDARRAAVRVSGGLPVKIIRALARSMEWRVRWKTSRESGSPPFDGSSTNWDRNKTNLIYWSDFYDNILQHPECPEDSVINDDEKLQEWLNLQLLKRQQARAVLGGRTLQTRNTNGTVKNWTKIGETKMDVNTPFKLPSGRKQ